MKLLIQFEVIKKIVAGWIVNSVLFERISMICEEKSKLLLQELSLFCLLRFGVML